MYFNSIKLSLDTLPWAALTFSFNEFRVFWFVAGWLCLVAVWPGSGRGCCEGDHAKAPEERTSSNHAATSLAGSVGTQPCGTNSHRVLARPVWEPRCAPAQPTAFKTARQGKCGVWAGKSYSIKQLMLLYENFGELDKNLKE